MKYSIIILFLTFCFFTGAGQTKEHDQSKEIDIPAYVWKVYDSLKARGVSNMISVERSFFGMHILDSLGGPDIYFDILWEINDTSYFQLIKFYSDRVIRTQRRIINDDDLFPLFSMYYDSIKAEEFLPCVIKSETNGIESYRPLTPIHKTMYDMLLFSKKEVLQKSFEDSYLLQNFVEDYVNLNYKYNNSTKLMMLWKKIWKIIKSQQ